MIGPLTQPQLFKLARAGVLLKLAGDVLSTFEADLVAEVRERWLSLGRAIVVTAAEWAVIDQAIAAMTQARWVRYGRAA